MRTVAQASRLCTGGTPVPLLAALWLLPVLLVAACERERVPTVVIYTSVDQEYAEEIIAIYQRENPVVRIQPRFDTEATKTLGLVERLRAERDRPQADILWSNEVFLTIKLAEEGVLEPFHSDTLEDWPEHLRDPDGYWYAFALRPRVIGYDRDRVSDPPRYWTDLTDEKWRGRVVIADPHFGTTRGHLAAWFALWGPERAEQFLSDLVANDIRVVQSNSQSVREVRAGTADLALTDGDDVWAIRRNQYDMGVVYPRHGDGTGMGTLLIPNTVSLIAGREHGEHVIAFAEFLLSPRVEELLYATDSRNLPVRAQIELDPEHIVEDPLTLDYREIAEAMPAAMEAMGRTLMRRR